MGFIRQLINKRKSGQASWLLAIYSSLIMLSLAAYIGLNALVISNNIEEAERRFNKNANKAYNHISAALNTNASVLDGFSAFLDGVDIQNPVASYKYTKKILNRYPYIYQIQAAQYVHDHNFEAFNQQAQGRISNSFSIKKFTSQGILDVQPGNANFYYPLIFVAPIKADDLDVRGLDLSTIPFINTAMVESQRSSNNVLTEAFESVEGEDVFVMLQPSYLSGQKIADLFGLLVIKTAVLLPLADSYAERLAISLAIEGSDDFLIQRQQVPWEASRWDRYLPTFRFQQALNIGAQKLNLNIRFNADLSIIDIGVIIGISVFTLILVTALWIMYLVHRKSELAQLRYSEQLYQLANFDTLTKLSNRRHFDEAAEYALATAARSNTSISLLYFDLDGFKEINDTLGHQVGDVILVETANILNSSIRQTDIASRLGGDEFVILLEGKTEIDNVLHRVAERISRITEVDGQSVCVGISVGSAKYPDDGDCIKALINAADKRMYQNKDRRKQRLSVV